MAVSVTNRKSAQSLPSQSAWVKLNATDSANLANITIGQQVILGSNNKIGYVVFVDTYGHAFKIRPQMNTKDLSSSTTPGYLNAGESISLQ